MSDKFATLEWTTSRLQRDDWLLYLNYLLGTVRGEAVDARLREDTSRRAVPPHVVQFLAKLTIRNASQHGPVHPTWDWFVELRDLVIGLPDPIQDDLNWKHGNPTDFFVRVLNQQMPAQETRRIQRIGLALGLFRDLDPLADGFDLPAAVERALSMSVDAFMRLGFATMAFRQASCAGHPCCGTFSREYLEKAGLDRISACTPNNWKPFLQRVAIAAEKFREACQIYETLDREVRYPQFEFNPLRRYPIVEVANGRYIAPDPYLIGERGTFGIFYDLFEQEGVDFSETFGHCFERFVEDLLLSCIPSGKLWTAQSWDTPERSDDAPSKHVDLAVRGDQRLVLIECKSMRTSLKLATYADNESVTQMADRIAQAVQQAAEHSESIASGEWLADGLKGHDAVCAIVTYGKMYATNSPFVRRAVRSNPRLRGLQIPPWVVLSLEELDTAVSLVDEGEKFDHLIKQLSSDEDAFDPLIHHYRDKLRKNSTSRFAKTKGAEFMDQMTPNETRHNRWAQ